MTENIPNPDLQREYMATTGTNSMAEVQWLMHFKRTGKSNRESIRLTITVFETAHRALAGRVW